MLTIDQLLEEWARWRARRSDNGLGFKASSLNRMMAGDDGGAKGVGSVIPCDVDADGVLVALDRGVAALPLRRREVVICEYCRVGLQKDKARGFMMTDRMYRKHLFLAQQQLSSLPLVKSLLKNA